MDPRDTEAVKKAIAKRLSTGGGETKDRPLLLDAYYAIGVLRTALGRIAGLPGDQGAQIAAEALTPNAPHNRLAMKRSVIASPS